jgi:DNA-binding transcriptional ArsR family regulator
MLGGSTPALAWKDATQAAGPRAAITIRPDLGSLARRLTPSRPAASQHLRVLREADLVSVRAEGNRRLYRVQASRLAELQAMLDQFWGARLAGLQARLATPGREMHQ